MPGGKSNESKAWDYATLFQEIPTKRAKKLSQGCRVFKEYCPAVLMFHFIFGRGIAHARTNSCSEIKILPEATRLKPSRSALDIMGVPHSDRHRSFHLCPRSPTDCLPHTSICVMGCTTSQSVERKRLRWFRWSGSSISQPLIRTGSSEFSQGNKTDFFQFGWALRKRGVNSR